jgi:hypothetical protein
LRDGSFVSGPVAFGDESAMRLSFAGRKDVPVLNSKIARMLLRPPRQRVPFEISSNRRGLILKNGDFFESEFQRIEHGSITVSSVLFGLKRFSIEGGGPVAVVLNDLVPSRAPFKVRLLDGSSFSSLSLSANAHSLMLEEPVLGRFSIPTSELLQIEHTELADKSAARRGHE